ncbi:MAG: insulinase family protein [Clostridiales bacterium]|nr:insulinase family protein [Clostridiales bacterium]
MLNDVTFSELLPGVHLICLHTDKFKTGCLSVSLLRHLRGEEAAKNALIMPVLMRGTRRCPDMERLSAAMDDLYGAGFGVLLRKRAETQAFGIAADFIDDRFAPEGGILRGCADLMSQLLLDPAGGPGAFVPEYFESERRNLLDAIAARVNDKHAWAVRRLIEIMCPGEPYAIDKLGTAGSLESLISGDLYLHWRDMLSRGQMLLFYGGSARPGDAAAMLKDSLSGLPQRTEPDALPAIIRKSAGETKLIRENMDVAQGRLCIGWRFDPDADIPYAAAVLFNAVFGGTSASKLFMNVRERLSLCYSVDSTLDRRKKLMFVTAGVEFSDLERCRDEVFAQLRDCAQGKIEPCELESARACIVSALKLSGDSLGSLEDYYTTRALYGESLESPGSFISSVMAVSKEDIAALAEQAKLDTVYFLSGYGEEAEKDGPQ